MSRSSEQFNFREPQEKVVAMNDNDSSVASERGSRIESYRARCVVEIVMDWWIADGGGR